MINCFSVFNQLNLLSENSSTFNEYGQLEMKKSAAHYYKGDANNTEQYKNKLGTKWQKFKYDIISKPGIPKSMVMHDQEEKKTYSSKKGDFGKTTARSDSYARDMNMVITFQSYYSLLK